MGGGDEKLLFGFGAFGLAVGVDAHLYGGCASCAVFFGGFGDEAVAELSGLVIGDVAVERDAHDFGRAGGGGEGKVGHSINDAALAVVHAVEVSAFDDALRFGIALALGDDLNADGVAKSIVYVKMCLDELFHFLFQPFRKYIIHLCQSLLDFENAVV